MIKILFVLFMLPAVCFAQIKLNTSFENGDPLAGDSLRVSDGTCLPGQCATVSSEFANTGTKSLKFVIDSSDDKIFGAVRNEEFAPKDSTHPYRFYKMSIMVRDYINDGKNMLLWQVKQGFTPTYTDNLPPASLWIQNGRWIFWVQFDSVDVAINTHLVQRSYDLGPVVSNGFTNFVFEMKQSINYDGFIRFYRNNLPLKVKRFGGTDSVYTVHGANTNKQYGRQHPYSYSRYGPYSFGGFGAWFHRVFFIDDLGIFDETFTIDQIIPVIPVPVPSPARKVKGYKFLNSNSL